MLSTRPMAGAPLASTFIRHMILTADAGAFVINGGSVKQGRGFNAEAGSFDINASAADLRANRHIIPDAGIFIINGMPATSPSSKALRGEGATFLINRNAADLKLSRKLPLATGTFTINGKAANLLHAWKISADKGGLIINYSAANFSKTIVFTLNAKPATSFVINGQNARLYKYSGMTYPPLIAVTGRFKINGIDALLWTPFMKCDAGEFLIKGTSARLFIRPVGPEVTRQARIYGNVSGAKIEV